MVWPEHRDQADVLSIRSAERRVELLQDVASIRSGYRTRYHPPPPPPRKPFLRRLKSFIRVLTAWIFSNIGICVLVLGYLLLGAAMFEVIESCDARPSRHQSSSDAAACDRESQVVAVRARTVAELWNITEQYNLLYPGLWAERAAELVLRYQEAVVRAEAEEGFDGNDKLRDPWDFSAALLYSITVITTIGYGNMVPVTSFGKIVSIFYAVIGVPLFLLYLSNIGNIMAGSFKWTYSRICRCQLVKRKRKDRFRVSNLTEQLHPGMVKMTGGSQGGGSQRTQEQDSVSDHSLSVTSEDLEEEEEEEYLEEEDGMEPIHKVAVPVTLSLSVMVSYICGGAILFGEWEKWGFLDGFYFCFITLSTIGFGDFVPGNSVKKAAVNPQFIFCSLYILLGMAVIAMCFSLMQEKVVRGVKSIGRQIGIVKSENR